MKRVSTDEMKKALRNTMDFAGRVEQAMRKAEGKEKSRLKALFFRLVKIRADMIDTMDRIKRQRHPEEWK